MQGDSSGRFYSNECFVLAENIKHMEKYFKTHKSTLEFDRKFCTAAIVHSSNNYNSMYIACNTSFLEDL